jgi:hypothetical protein
MISPLVLWDAPDNHIERAMQFDAVGRALRRRYD